MTRRYHGDRSVRRAEIEQIDALKVLPLFRRLALALQTPRPLDAPRSGEARRLLAVLEQKAWNATKHPKAVEARFLRMVARHRAPEESISELRGEIDAFLVAGGDLPAGKSLFGEESALGTGDPFGPSASFARGIDPFVTARALREALHVCRSRGAPTALAKSGWRARHDFAGAAGRSLPA